MVTKSRYNDPQTARGVPDSGFSPKMVIPPRGYFRLIHGIFKALKNGVFA